VRNRPGRALACSKHERDESIDRIAVHSLEATDKCKQGKDFSRPMAKAGRDRAFWLSFRSQVE
jgi:hypothetical protein